MSSVSHAWCSPVTPLCALVTWFTSWSCGANPASTPSYLLVTTTVLQALLCHTVDTTEKMSTLNFKAKRSASKTLCDFSFLPPEPDFSYLDALAPYQPLAMKCVYCPIDTRLNFHQVSKLLKEVQVRSILVCHVTIPFINMVNAHFFSGVCKRNKQK